jgi:hypothetical protein
MIADRPYTNGLQLGNCLIGFRSVAIALLNSDTSSFVANSNPTGEIITVGRVSLNDICFGSCYIHVVWARVWTPTW